MNSYNLYSKLGKMASSTDVVIQLPDNNPPVDFEFEVINGTLVLFPIPENPDNLWDHDTNVITSSPPAEPVHNRRR